MENQNFEKFRTLWYPQGDAPNGGQGVGNVGEPANQSPGDTQQQTNPETDNDKGSDKGNSNQDERQEELFPTEAQRNNPATLYNKAVEMFDPEERNPQLAEHTIYRDKEFERDGIL